MILLVGIRRIGLGIEYINFYKDILVRFVMRLRDVILDCVPGVGLFTTERRINKSVAVARKEFLYSPTSESSARSKKEDWKGLAYCFGIAVVQIGEAYGICRLVDIAVS